MLLPSLMKEFDCFDIGVKNVANAVLTWGKVAVIGTRKGKLIVAVGGKVFFLIFKICLIGKKFLFLLMCLQGLVNVCWSLLMNASAFFFL